jgi:hypothetical protein
VKRIREVGMSVLKFEGVAFIVCLLASSALWGLWWVFGADMALNPLELGLRILVAVNCIGALLATFVAATYVVIGRKVSRTFGCTTKEGREAVTLRVLASPRAWEMSSEQFQLALGQARLGKPINVTATEKRGRTTPKGTRPNSGRSRHRR